MQALVLERKDEMLDRDEVVVEHEERRAGEDVPRPEGRAPAGEGHPEAIPAPYCGHSGLPGTDPSVEDMTSRPPRIIRSAT